MPEKCGSEKICQTTRISDALINLTSHRCAPVGTDARRKTSARTPTYKIEVSDDRVSRPDEKRTLRIRRTPKTCDHFFRLRRAFADSPMTSVVNGVSGEAPAGEGGRASIGDYSPGGGDGEGGGSGSRSRNGNDDRSRGNTAAASKRGRDDDDDGGDGGEKGASDELDKHPLSTRKTSPPSKGDAGEDSSGDARPSVTKTGPATVGADASAKDQRRSATATAAGPNASAGNSRGRTGGSAGHRTSTTLACKSCKGSRGQLLTATSRSTRICGECMRLPEVDIGDGRGTLRYCCGHHQLEPLSDFDGTRSRCREALSR